MTDARILITFAAVLVLALFFVQKKVNPSFAPLCALGGGVILVGLFGCFDLLRLGGWIFFGLAALSAIWLFYRVIIKKTVLPPLSFGFWFFVLASILFMTLLWIKQPMFTGWDEFSLWGTASKLMKLNDEFYVTAPVGWPWTATQKPAAIIPGYLFQFFGAEFREWQTYVGIDLLLLAMMSAALAPFTDKKHNNAAFPIMLILVLTPFIFYHYQNATKISQAYLDTLGDIPLGFAFASALAVWFSVPKKTWQTLLPLGISLVLLTLTKETGFALALVASVLFFFDAFFMETPKKSTYKTVVKNAFLYLAFSLGCISLSFGGWGLYLNSAPEAIILDTAGSTATMSMTSMPFAFISDLLNPEKSEFFTTITTTMVRFFFTAPGNMLGSGFIIFILVCLLLAFSIFLWPLAANIKRCITFGVLSSLGFVAWYALVTMSYLYILRPEQALGFESYDRYVFPYYIGWLIAAMVIFSVSVTNASLGKATLGKLGLIATSFFILLRVFLMVPPHYTIFGAHQSEYSYRYTFSQHVQDIRSELDPNGKTFLVYSGDTGIGWFMYCHEMLPWQLDYSFSGLMQLSIPQEDGSTIRRAITVNEWQAYLIENGITTVYIEHADAEFVANYSTLFSDGMQSYQNGDTNLYDVVLLTNRTVTLTPRV